MAAEILSLHVSWPIYMIATQVQQLSRVIGSEITANQWEYCPMHGKIVKRRRRILGNNVYQRSNTSEQQQIQRLCPTFRGHTIRRNFPMYWCVVHRRWRPINGSRWELTWITSRIHHSNDIRKDVPMFSMSIAARRDKSKNKKCQGLSKLGNGSQNRQKEWQTAEKASLHSSSETETTMLIIRGKAKQKHNGYQPPPASKRPLNTWDWRLGWSWCRGVDRKRKWGRKRFGCVVVLVEFYLAESKFDWL